MKKKSVNIVTLGCSKNLVDSEKILGQLDNERFDLFHDLDKPTDVVIINTCGFINDAKQESIDTILQFVEAKKHGDIENVIVCGCLSQRYKEELAKEIEYVDAWFGVEENEGLFKFLNQDYEDSSVIRKVTTPSHYAYLKISEGCDRFCSFCAIPFIRGAYKSLPIESLVNEATLLAEKGVKELLLVAQDLNLYGLDLYGEMKLGNLLNELSKIKGIEWIRLHYAYPHNFPDDVVSIMANNPKVCKYLDIPIQHINSNILSSMKRGHGRKETTELVDNLRKQIPDIAIRTTLLVGYPGETKEMFEELLDFVKEYKFERLGVFTYSPEEGTTAFSLKDSIPEKTKQLRADKLMKVQQEISLELNHLKIGKIFNVLVDREEEQYFVGRTEYDSPEIDNEVLIKKNKKLIIGNFYDVKITDAAEFELFGEIKN
ncbi:MAG: 30S ribosomal protein S12 methylthiotransferase RimO [Bacteroidales bacterium]